MDGWSGSGECHNLMAIRSNWYHALTTPYSLIVGIVVDAESAVCDSMASGPLSKIEKKGRGGSTSNLRLNWGSILQAMSVFI